VRSWKRALRRVHLPPSLPGPGNLPVRESEAAARPSALTLRDERILLTLAVQTQQLNDRLTRLEDRVEAGMRDAAAQPDQQDLLELRLHSARLAAELSRVTVELRAEINDLRDDAPASTRTDDTGPVDDTELIDLREAEPPARPHVARGSGWRPSRSTPRNDDD
jgi:hypothetical protein